MQRNRLRDAIVLGLMGGLGFGGNAFADDAKDAAKAAITTGSLIARQPGEQGYAPVRVLDRDDIAATGLSSLADVLFYLTESDGRALRTDTTSNITSDGTQHVSFRGLGSDKVLVLVNGRRWAKGGVDDRLITDLQTIPLSIVGRIEVMTEGASALYGSDAVGGVVNIVTRDDLDGGELQLYHGSYKAYGGDQQAFDLSFGGQGERWGSFVTVGYAEQEEILAGEVPIASVPVFGGGDLASGGLFGSGTNPYNNMVRCATAFVLQPTGFNTCTPVAGGPFTLRPGEDGRQATDFRRFISYTLDGSGSSDRYNFAPVNSLLQPVERKHLFFSGSYELSDDISAHLSIGYVNKDSSHQREEAAATMDVRGTNGARWAFAPTAGNVFNPFGQNLRSSFYRVQALGPSQSQFENDSLAATLRLQGGFDLGGKRMEWEAGYSHHDSSQEFLRTNTLNLFNLRQAVGDSRRNPITGALECLNGVNVIPGCVPFNVFGGPDLGLAAGVITQAEYDAMLAYVRSDLRASSDISGNEFFARIGGTLFEMPAGPLGFSLAVESRHDSVEASYDVLANAGGSSYSGRIEATNGETTTRDWSLEFRLPLVADAAFAKRLELGLAYRRSDIDAEGLFRGAQVRPDIEAQTATQFGLIWEANEQFLIRASFSDSFRAPDALDLFNGGEEQLRQTADPCNTFNIVSASTDFARCTSDGVPGAGIAQPNALLTSFFGGNPFLESEEAKTRSFGFVYRPSWAEGLSIAIDRYKIEVDGGLVFVSAQAILNGCYQLPGQPGAASNPALREQYCSFVTRGAGGVITDLRSGYFNLDSGEITGYDLRAEYIFPETFYGNFTLNLDVNSTRDNSLSGIPGLYAASNPNWERRANFAVHWQKGEWDATWATRYYSEMEEFCNGFNYFEYGITPSEVCTEVVVSTVPAVSIGVNHIPSQVYHDLQIGWKTPWNGKFSIGARNLLDKDPPIIRRSLQHSFDGAYDGARYVYLQYRQEF